MQLSAEEKVEYYRYLNLPSTPEPTMQQIGDAYQELRLAYEKRAANPVTPSDFAVRDRLRKAQEAYERLCHVKNSKKGSPSRAICRYYRIGVGDLISIYQRSGGEPFFTVQCYKRIACDCKRLCPSCEAKAPDGECQRCKGNGWVWYCQGCHGRGERVESYEKKYPLGKINQDYLWIQDDGAQTSLRVFSQQGVSMRGEELWYQHEIVLQDLVKNNMRVAPVTILLGDQPFSICLDGVRCLSGWTKVPLTAGLKLPGLSELHVALIPVRDQGL